MSGDFRTFEDIVPGERHEAGPIQVTREAIVAFAEMYDPQPFHLDEAAGDASLLGGMAASGWQTASLGMRLLFDGFVGRIASMGSPGLDEVRWLKPVRPGDSLRMSLVVTTARASATRPDRGFIGLAMDLMNAAGETVMTQTFAVIVQRRGAAQTGAAHPPPTGASFTPAIPDADPMLTGFYNDVVVGHESILGAQRFTSELVTGFAGLYDPQYFHLDAEAARHSHFGGLCASGWQTAAFWMRHYLAARTRSAEVRAAAGLPWAVGGPSPGFTDLKWLRPVYVGQTVRYELKLLDKRRVSRSGWGMVYTLNTGRLMTSATSVGEVVFSFCGRLLWPMAPEQA